MKTIYNNKRNVFSHFFFYKTCDIEHTFVSDIKHFQQKINRTTTTPTEKFLLFFHFSFIIDYNIDILLFGWRMKTFFYDIHSFFYNSFFSFLTLELFSIFFIKYFFLFVFIYLDCIFLLLFNFIILFFLQYLTYIFSWIQHRDLFFTFIDIFFI